MSDLINGIMQLFNYELEKSTIDLVDLELKKIRYKNKLIDVFKENDKI